MASPPSNSGAGGLQLRRPGSHNNDFYDDTENAMMTCNRSDDKYNTDNTDHTRLFAAFWAVGVLNHSAYILMLACAKDIIEGGTALVFLANIVPGLLIKSSAPYWFDAVSYETRIQGATMSMMTGYVLVAAASSRRATYSIGNTGDFEADNGGSSEPVWLLGVQLLGVALANAQCSLGEASLLAFAGRLDAGLEQEETEHNQAPKPIKKNKGPCLTCLSSGTGMAGVFGFFWKWFWVTWMGLSLSQTLILALGLGVGYWMTFRYIQTHQPPTPPKLLKVRNKGKVDEDLDGNLVVGDSSRPPTLGYVGYGTPTTSTVGGEFIELLDMHDTKPPAPQTPLQNGSDISVSEETCMIDTLATTHTILPPNDNSDSHDVVPIPEMTSAQRFQLVLSLWPYAAPLFVVYAAEYALQSGTWTAIGFPVQDRESRNHFFQFSNWIYFVGSFVSRSSGVLYTAPMWVLWLMPLLQFINLAMTTHVAANPTTSILYHPHMLYSGA